MLRKVTNADLFGVDMNTSHNKALNVRPYKLQPEYGQSLLSHDVLGQRLNNCHQKIKSHNLLL